MGELKDRLAKIPREDGRWLLETLPGSLWRASKTARLHQLLTDFDFMQAKLAECGVQALIEDYDLAMSSDVLLNPEQTETLQLIAGTLRLSAHVLASDTTKLAEQLLGRLLSFENPEIVALLEQGKQWRGKPWFCPLTANLTPPGGPLIRTLTGHSSWVNAVAIAPDGKRAVSASDDNTLKLWDLETGTELATLTGHSDDVNAVVIAPDGKRAVSASDDKTLKLWDLETGTELATLRGHSDWVRAVAIAPDGKRAVSASEDETLKLWDLETGTELATLTGP
ncbi:WD40 repeat domain-containing protein, partial [Limnospira sp. PMC 1243.20]|uniref:WD40 repeat domain-containing protein n=1 Tax=Limnospira sp. PMC 1243.20 TaxID=2981041 RepID=UPI0028E1047C